jgi:hypothetical protein
MINKSEHGASPRTPTPTTGDGYASWSLPPTALVKARLGWPLPAGFLPQKRPRAAGGAQAPDGDTAKSPIAFNSATEQPKGRL